MTPRDNCYILGYEGPNEIYQDFLERVQTLITVVEFSDPKDETVTCGSPYNIAMLKILETGHLGTMLISPN